MKEDRSFKLNGRIWVESDSGRFLGTGRVGLLECIKASQCLYCHLTMNINVAFF